MPEDTSQNTRSFVLGDNLVHGEAEALLQALREFEGQPLNISADKVSFIGAQCVQILVAAARSWAREETPFAVTERSVGFNEAIGRFGISGPDLPGEEAIA